MIKKIAGIIFRNIPRRLRQRFVRLSQNKFTASVAAVVFNKDGEVLLLDHVLRPQPGWAIPGGFMESGEQPVEAVKRELCEETGLNLIRLEMFRVRTAGRHIEFLFRAEAVGTAEVKSLEINAVGWFDVEKLPERMRESEKSMIRELSKNSL
ncbi:MAG: NUDIX domain-containing protein [Acidobacteriota bacterium]|nr:NUDIX domain-containing protein [Acidobacteriota bacterium]